jgi:hypothetical protein
MITVLPTRIQLIQLFPKGSVGAEVGVFRGDMSQALMRIVRPAKLHLVDMWETWYSPEYAAQLDPLCLPAPLPADTQGAPAMTGAQWLAAREHLEVMFAGQPVEFHVGVSWQKAADFEDASLDWVYIDGDHRREGCLADLMAYYPKVKPAGLICGHDFCYIFPGVQQAVIEFVQSGKAEMIALDRSEFTSYVMRKK